MGSQTELDVVMTAANAALDEVVVVGYGTQRKKDVTGAISSVSAKQIEERQAIDVLDAMQGQALGCKLRRNRVAPVPATQYVSVVSVHCRVVQIHCILWMVRRA